LQQRGHHQPQAACVDRLPGVHGGAAREPAVSGLGRQVRSRAPADRGADPARVPSAVVAAARTVAESQAGLLHLPPEAVAT
jgi:hypothetical protein